MNECYEFAYNRLFVKYNFASENSTFSSNFILFDQKLQLVILKYFSNKN